MTQQGQDLQRRVDEAVARARLAPETAVDRAAGLLAGRTGCMVDEAHTYLLRRATELGRSPSEVATELLTVLDSRTPSGSSGLDTAVDQALRSRPVRAARSPAGSAQVAEHVSAEWAQAVQQVLGALPENHTVVVPVRDTDGEVADFVFAAVSPHLEDLSGRRGVDLIGAKVSEAYPTVADSPVWQAWLDTVADGKARQVGPMPYVGDSDRAPDELTLTVNVEPIGPGLLNSWIRHDDETRLADRIAQTERLGNFGWGEADLVTGKIVWSDGMYRIYQRDPALGPLSNEEQDALALPEDEPIRRQAAEAFGRGETVDIVFRVNLSGRIKHLRTVVDASRDAHGRPVKLYGIVQDVTAQERSRTRLAQAEQLLRQHEQHLLAEHQLAVQLQHIVLPLPAEPFDLPGLRVALRYLPAEQANRVGGDWFHAAMAPDGNVVLAVGDVAGHGMPAATVMAQLRHMLAGLTVTTTTEPARLLHHLNRLLYAGEVTATLVVARFDPRTGEMMWAQAGHPPPLLTRDGATCELARPAGPLLGAIRDAGYDTAMLTLDDGDLLLFYTDGLVEHREHTLEEGLVPVVAALNRISRSGTSQPLADLLANLRRANPDDDTCVLAVRRLSPRRESPQAAGDHA